MAGRAYGSQRSGPPALGRFLTPAPGAESEEEAEERYRPSGRVSTPPPAPPPKKPLPSEQPRPTGSDPTRPTRPKIVEDWEAIFHLHGRRGLQKAFYDFARQQQGARSLKEPDEKANSDASWGYVMSDEEKGTDHVLHLLHTLPDFMIPILLRGELAFQIKSDDRVREYVKDHMQLGYSPGIYLNILRDSSGRWLSSSDMDRFLNIMSKYLNSGGSGKPSAEQVEIDNRLSPWRYQEKPMGKKVRWLQDPSQELVVGQWIEQARKAYCNNAISPDKPFLSCPMEVGWATEPVSRCRGHMSGTSTNPLFGLAYSILNMPRPEGFSFPEPMQLLLFPVWKREALLGRNAEIIGSLLCYSYWFHGGWNGDFAGCMRWDDEAASTGRACIPPGENETLWGESAKRFWSRLQVQEPNYADIQKQRNWRDLLYDATRREALEKEFHQLKAETQIKSAELRDLKADLGRLETQKEELQERFDQRMPGTQRDATLEERLKTLSLAQKKVNERKANWDDFKRRHNIDGRQSQS